MLKKAQLTPSRKRISRFLFSVFSSNSNRQLKFQIMDFQGLGFCQIWHPAEEENDFRKSFPWFDCFFLQSLSSFSTFKGSRALWVVQRLPRASGSNPVYAPFHEDCEKPIYLCEWEILSVWFNWLSNFPKLAVHPVFTFLTHSPFV